jgi:hypothetical protein
MASRLSRRKFLTATAAAAGVPGLARPAVVQQKPVKIGLMTVKTGGLAAGGVHLEEGITCFLKDKNFTLAGRKIELVVADTAAFRQPRSLKRSNWSSVIKSISSWDRLPPSNGSRSRIILASTRCRLWVLAAPKI